MMPAAKPVFRKENMTPSTLLTVKLCQEVVIESTSHPDRLSKTDDPILEKAFDRGAVQGNFVRRERKSTDYPVASRRFHSSQRTQQGAARSGRLSPDRYAPVAASAETRTVVVRSKPNLRALA
jgi:hypothetical protein